MVTCSMVQLGANTILNYLKPFLLGLLKSSVKYILVYKSLMHSSHCSVFKLLALRRGNERETRLQTDGGFEKVLNLNPRHYHSSPYIKAMRPNTACTWSQQWPPTCPALWYKLQVRRLESGDSHPSWLWEAFRSLISVTLAPADLNTGKCPPIPSAMCDPITLGSLRWAMRQAFPTLLFTHFTSVPFFVPEPHLL